MTDANGDSIVGSLGYVTNRIRGGDAPGEVQIHLRGGSESFIAFGAEPIDRGEKILVVGKRPGRALDVTVFTD
jgi:hypothetical protein